ncbi:hypothetical protein METBIDRAFT_36879 [Metschnikowia bicuspidata var. bicuspidata NRRL YB-4993]|uniref:TFG box profile domain-containing protein n=1 Tax=Metschnikowia bicuspidata var. bicuspidata NRRL YB-4993 TaxID=869754 RepID=A0A1A0HJS7_9ASCO|nr:hypothetical protein METBIDRAFT_36879 [Metschnikowia bicuspidata var. bicuspidata NRRL YB-4993]OBA24068.1 hypothetical protein METBIDRAFT_36879 [Metschnikowia bicuspidata var. bicuspidata NRRL YB-4993]
MSQYIGKTISLISNKGLRYVGVLDKISADDATVSLKSVRPFGTEGRMAEQGLPSMEVMPSAEIYDYVVFRGSDVKDLNVLDTPIDQVRPVTYYAPPAAATLSGSAAPAATPTTDTPEPTKTSSEAPRERAVPTPALGFSDAYDFEEANRRFEKEKQQDAAAKPTYDKKSLFFDSISLNEHQGSMRWHDEKTLNMDTFGQAYAHKGRGGSRGRGGRGRGNGYRGRGRGNRGRGSAEAKPEWA